MHIAVCIDDRGGMLFNGRRQSMDREVRSDLLRSAQGARLWMSAYTRRQFPGEPEGVLVAEDFLARAEAGDWCFVEGRPLRPWLERIESLTLYHWGRTYPADRYLDVCPAEEGWRLTEQRELSGRSHKTITKEVYLR